MSSLLSLNFRNQNKMNDKNESTKIMKKEEKEIMESTIINKEPQLIEEKYKKREELNMEKEELNIKNISNSKECILKSEMIETHQGQNMDPINCKWYGEFENDGSISCIGNNGNIRVLYGDSLILKLYTGIIEGENFGLRIENFFGESVIMKASRDTFGNCYWDLNLEYSGSIEICIVVLENYGKEVDSLNKSLKHNILIIEPKLYINNNYIPNSGICMQTILSQCLGNIKNWKRRLEIISKLNYNMVHFTPLQKFGQSGSCYSLADQNEISSIFFKEENKAGSIINEENNMEFIEYTKEEKYNHLKKVIEELENDFGILSACDIVLNHTADNSPWLIDHPECGYCLNNSPHLTASVELDKKLQEFSNNIYNGKYIDKYGIDRNINNMKQIDSIILALKEEIIIPFNIKEYFILDIDKIIENSKKLDKQNLEYEEILNKIRCDDSIENKLYNIILHFTCTKRGKMISIPSSILNKLDIKDKEIDLRNILENIQKRLFEFTDEINNRIYNSIRGLIIWERIECKKGPIGLNHWEALTPRYFTPIKDKNGEIHYLANNGWVMGWNAKDDFASSGTFVYLKRDLIVWSDCVKLRYGKNKSDAPFLWEHMSNYCRSVAKIFHGIRLDNCHSTPLHVAKYMLRECRKVRPNIWVYAELFTGDYQVDLEFERNLGLNALIREAMRAENPGSLGFSVSNYSTAPIGGLSTIPSIYQSVNIEQSINDIKNNIFPMLPIICGTKPLKKLSCPAIFFDCTHDNETPCEIRTPIDTLPTAALVASTNCALGSTRGFDELVPHNISVVSERRLYQNYIINIYEDTIYDKDDSNKNINIRSRSNSLGPFQKLSSNYLSELSTINWNYGETKNKNSNISTEVTVEWRHHANNVEIRGDWDGWKEGIKLDKHPNGNFVTKLFIKFGKDSIQESESFKSSCKIIHPINNSLQYQYKYIVDGNWVHDPNLPYSIDNNGNINNTITLLKRQRSIAIVSKWKYGDQLPGIMSARKILNKLHQQMSIYGFNESHVHYLTEDIIMVQRYNPKIQENIYFITHSSFSYDKIDQLPSSVVLDGCIKDTVFAGTLFVPNYTSVYENDSDRIHGLDSELHKYKKLEEIANVTYNQDHNQTILDLMHFPPGSLVILHTIRHKGFSVTQNSLIEFYKNIQISLPKIINDFLDSDKCHPSDAINYILFSCNNEELDRSQGKRGVYNVPNFGDFVYSGIYSCIHAFDTARKMDDNGKSHPFIIHLKQGPWYINYCIERLKQYAGTGMNGHKKNYPKNKNENFDENNNYPLLELANWIEKQYNLIHKIAHIPIEYIITYIDIMFSSIYRYILYYILNNSNNFNLNINSNTITEFFMKHDPLYIHLQLSTYQLYSYVPSSPLVWKTKIPSISAGLPHFSTGFMRSWGRDTFIAFNGILLSSKRYIEAKEEILGIARLVKYGLIPNLIDSGNRPRYNARDATWFFVYSVMEYCKIVSNGTEILYEDVELRYPISIQEISDQKNSFDWLIKKSNNQQIESLKIYEIIQYILTKHVVGIKFREENAGIQLDEQMKDLGFNIEIKWDSNNGFIYGGNVHNCGTWMDKMGSSIKANNKGIPSSPRDGADIEIIALIYSIINYITQLEKNNKFPFKGIQYSNNNFISYLDWSNLIKSNFERCFYIPKKNELNSNYEIETKFINRTEIYKDTYKSTHLWTDYQLRPNVVVAISVANDLFDSDHAFKTLQNVEKYLFSPNMLGIKTLDPSDYNYRPNYDNSNDSDDFKVAHGFNYHQGPEWVWPIGHFLTAKYNLLIQKYKTIDKNQANKLAIYETMKHLINHRKYIVNDQWGSLPELTNDNGTFCKDSCYSQAWSVGTILHFLTYTLNH